MIYLLMYLYLCWFITIHTINYQEKQKTIFFLRMRVKNIIKIINFINLYFYLRKYLYFLQKNI